MKTRRGIGVILLLTVLAVSGMFLYDATTQTTVTTVETVQLSRQTVKETVICTGSVTTADGVEVYAPMPCVAGEVAVKVGDRVKEGDVLVSVDRSATLALALGAGLSEEQTVMASAAMPLSVTAPSSGVVSAVSAVGGELLSTDTPCVILSQEEDVRIAITIRERALPQVCVGQEVAVSGVAFQKEVYKGTISHIASTARTRVSGTSGETVVDAVVTLADGEADASMLVGLSAKAAVTVATREQVLLVPYECLAQDERGEEYVYRVEDGVAFRTAVSVSEELPEGAVVTAGLAQGDTVVYAPEKLSGERAAVRTEAVHD